MVIPRPDLTNIDPDLLAYIEYLESLVAKKGKAAVAAEAEPELLPLTPDEPPTTICVITATKSGVGKRTYRHLYSRQRRGGIGVYDLEAPTGEFPSILSAADEDQTILLLTSLGRAFRIPVQTFADSPIRSRGSSILTKIHLNDNEFVSVLLPVQAQGYLATVSQNGMVRMLRHHIFGEHMKPGMAIYDWRSFGNLSAACWTSGEEELFLATRSGRGIRFPGKSLPPSGGQGIRLSDGDQVVAITSVNDNSRVFLLGADGRGTIRLMSGFSANKSHGAGGKIALITDTLVGAVSVDANDDIFILSRLSKIIRFHAIEVPEKEGTVQGVQCMSFRADEVIALLASSNLKHM